MLQYLIFGGTGSLGTALTKRLLEKGSKVAVFARGEERHRALKIKFPDVRSILGDVRDYQTIWSAIKTIKPDIVINASALKQIDWIEDNPEEAVYTNINGTINLINALQNFEKHQIKFLGVSTDKCANPSTAYGMTKALAERIHLNGQERTRHIHNVVRYGNVLNSTGSVIPVFTKLRQEYNNLQVFHKDMTRFLISLDNACNLIFDALTDIGGRKVFIPKIKSAKIIDIAEYMADGCVKVEVLNKIRPAEKLHEIMISSEELPRVQELANKFVLHDVSINSKFDNTLKTEYSSGNPEWTMSKEETIEFLKTNNI